MSDERKSEASGASAAIVIVLILCGLLGLLVVGGGALFAFVRMNSASEQAELMEARARAEMMVAQMQATKAELEATIAAEAAAAPLTKPAVPLANEIIIEINAAGDYKLAGKQMEYYDDLKAALLTAHIKQGDDLQVVISADKETRFNHVSKAVEAAECAGITKHRILTPSSQPPAISSTAADANSRP